MTVAQDLQDIRQNIGKLTGMVEAMVGRLDRNERDHAEFVKETQESRRRLHEKVEAQREETEAALREQHETLQAIQSAALDTSRNLSDIVKVVKEDVKPQTDMIRSLKTSGRSFLVAAGVAGGAIAWVVGNWGEAIWAFLTRR